MAAFQNQQLQPNYGSGHLPPGGHGLHYGDKWMRAEEMPLILTGILSATKRGTCNTTMAEWPIGVTVAQPIFNLRMETVTTTEVRRIATGTRTDAGIAGNATRIAVIDEDGRA